MNRIIRILLVASAVLSAAASARAQKDPKLIAGADFDTYFDNREYSGCEFGESQTLFSSRLTPWIGFGWNASNSLMVGMDLRSDFGNSDVTFEKARPQIYYRFENAKVSAYAGIFPRERMAGDYTEAILSDSMRFYDNRIQGFMGQYRGRRGFVELSVDWCGMYSEDSREKFRILSAGEYAFDNYRRRFYGGYALMMFHFAGSKRIVGCVNDNITIAPYVGARFEAFFDFDVKLRYIPCSATAPTTPSTARPKAACCRRESRNGGSTSMNNSTSGRICNPTTRRSEARLSPTVTAASCIRARDFSEPTNTYTTAPK